MLKGLLFLLLPIAFLCGWYIGRYAKDFPVKKYFLGLNYLLNEEPDRAVDAFLQLLDIDDQAIEIHLTLGSLFRRRGEVDKAIRLHQGLLARGSLPKQYQAMTSIELAKDYISAGVLDRAEKILQQLIKLKIELVSSYQLLINIYQQGKDWQRAIDSAKRLQSLNHVDLTVTIGQYYCELSAQQIALGELKNAKKYIKKALDSDPLCSRALILYGDLEFKKQAWKRALKYYQQIFKQDEILVNTVIERVIQCLENLQLAHTIESFFTTHLMHKPQESIILSLSNWLSISEGKEKALAFIKIYVNDFPTVKIVHRFLLLQSSCLSKTSQQALAPSLRALESIYDQQSEYCCQNCGFTSKAVEWLCPSCKSWGKMRPHKSFVTSSF